MPLDIHALVNTFYDAGVTLVAPEARRKRSWTAAEIIREAVVKKRAELRYLVGACAGDRILAEVEQTLDKFRVNGNKRSQSQKLMHKHFINAALPNI